MSSPAEALVNQIAAASWRFQSIHEEDLDKVSNIGTINAKAGRKINFFFR